MKLRLLFLLLVSLLLPALCLAAPKKKPASKENRSLKAVTKADGRRVALVIGNGAYRYTDSMPRLANPVNDADDIAAALRGFGFEVIEKKNLTREQMDEAVIDFGRRITNSDTALFYFAGHGLQVKGQNYIVPVDAKIEVESQVPYKALNLNQLLDEMDNSKSRVKIVMLDACRNNTFSGTYRSNGSRGLAAPSSMPKGTVIVYATDPGNVAADGNGRNGLFTAGLLAAFKGNDLTLGGVLYRASKEVEQASDSKQTPYINGPPTVQREFSFAPGHAVTAEEQPQQVAMAPRPQAPPPKLQPAPAGDSLDDIIAAKEATERNKKARSEKVKADVAKYRKIVASSPELKQQAWGALTRSYPEVRSLPVGDVGRLMKALGLGGGEDPTTGMEFVGVSGGCFQMGDTFGDGQRDEKPVHEVCVNGFSIGKYEVTKGQFRKFAEASGYRTEAETGDGCFVWNGSQWNKNAAYNWKNPGFSQDDSHPVACVSFNDSVAFARWLSGASGKSYRLPSEAEWEYAVRSGGRSEKYSGSNNIDAVAWYKNNSGSQTHPVGQKQANGLGIYDMSGNVWEWCSDWYGGSYYGSSPKDNPQGASSGTYRVLRGGSWGSPPGYVRASKRNNYDPDDRNSYYGFRLVSPSQD